MTGIDNKQTVATFRRYQEAEHAIDYLDNRGFPVEGASIVGRDLRAIEQVTGRLTAGGSVLRSMGGGAFTGLLIGWIFGLFNWIDPVITAIVLAFDGLVFGAVVGALFGLIVYLGQRGRRDFTSMQAVLPSHYDILTDPPLADQARSLLTEYSSRFAPHGADA